MGKGVIVVLLAIIVIVATMIVVRLVYRRVQGVTRHRQNYQATWKSYTELRDDGKVVLGVKKSYGAGEHEVVFRSLPIKVVPVDDLMEYSMALLEVDERADALNVLRSHHGDL